VAKKNQSGIHISRRGMLVWGGLIVFVAGWMFVLGIMVGRGLAPVNLEVGKLEQELAELKAKMLAQEKAKVEAQISGKENNLPELGYPEALTSGKKEEPFKSLPKKSSAKAKPVPEQPKKIVAKPKPVPKPKPKPVPKAKPKPKPQPASAVRPEVPSKPKSPPRSKPAPKTVAQQGRFSIQVAAVQNPQSAEQLAAKLRKQGYRAYRLRSEVAGKGVWYRVRVGAFENRGEADRVLGKLKADNFSGMVVSTQ